MSETSQLTAGTVVVFPVVTCLTCSQLQSISAARLLTGLDVLLRQLQVFPSKRKKNNIRQAVHHPTLIPLKASFRISLFRENYRTRLLIRQLNLKKKTNFLEFLQELPNFRMENKRPQHKKTFLKPRHTITTKPLHSTMFLSTTS